MKGDDGQGGHAPRFGRGIGQGHEPFGDQGYCRNALLLQLDAVVDTPRGAGASVAKAADYQVTLLCQFIDHFVGGWLTP